MESTFLIDLYATTWERTEEVWKADHAQAMAVCKVDESLGEVAGLNEAVAKTYHSCTGPGLLSSPRVWKQGKRMFAELFDAAMTCCAELEQVCKEVKAEGYTLEHRGRFEASCAHLKQLRDHFLRHWPSKKGEVKDLRRGLDDMKQGRYRDAAELLNELKSRTD
jgi:hypothetical protein